MIFVRDTKPGESEYKCSGCGRRYYLGGGSGKWTNTNYCKNVTIICGKTTSTIESATIDF